VTIIGTSLAQAVAGLNQAERRAVREADKKDRPERSRLRRDVKDEAQGALTAPDATEAIDGQPEEHQQRQKERQKHSPGGYRPDGSVSEQDRERGKLDIQV